MPADDELSAERFRASVDAVFHEFDFVSSMIPLYRRIQVQIVSLAIIGYGAVIGLVGALPKDNSGTRTLHTIINSVGALGPWLAVALVSAFLTAETRLVRASQYLMHDLYPRLERLVGRGPLLGYEIAPGARLKSYERWVFSNSLPMILILSAPAIVGGFLYLQLPAARQEPVAEGWTTAGMVVLGVVAIVAFLMTLRHEGRTSTRGTNESKKSFLARIVTRERS